jgi:hypothetical protein
MSQSKELFAKSCVSATSSVYTEYMENTKTTQTSKMRFVQEINAGDSIQVSNYGLGEPVVMSKKGKAQTCNDEGTQFVKIVSIEINETAKCAWLRFDAKLANGRTLMLNATIKDAYKYSILKGN